MKKYDVSVVVPFYNAAPFIEKCADSLFTQTLDNIQFIFINDKSSDDSLIRLNNVIDQYPHHRNNILIINHEQNRGSAAARNTGLDNSLGKYIGWVDADDWVQKDMFEKMFFEAKSQDADIIWMDFYYDYGKYKYRMNQKYDGDSIGYIKKMINGQLSGVLWNKLTKRCLYVKNNVRFPYGLDMCEDLRVNVQLFYFAKNVSYVEGALYYHSKMKLNSISTEAQMIPSVNEGWISNVFGVVSFLKSKGIALTNKEIAMRVLGAKNNLLVRGTEIKHFKEWRTVFREYNIYIWETNLPVYYKIIAWCADKKIWGIVWFWLCLKKTVKFTKQKLK